MGIVISLPLQHKRCPLRGGLIVVGRSWIIRGTETPKGEIRKITSLLDSGVFPGTQGGPLEHVIAAKAVAFEEALSDEYLRYVVQVVKNAQAMAAAFMAKGYSIISGGTDNHLMLIDLRSKNLTGKIAEETLIKADITINKNMVPFDTITHDHIGHAHWYTGHHHRIEERM